MYVEFNNAPPDIKNIKLGLPQGAVGSPLLFLLYIDDIFKATSRCSFLHFADDTTIWMAALRKRYVNINNVILLPKS